MVALLSIGWANLVIVVAVPTAAIAATMRWMLGRTEKAVDSYLAQRMTTMANRQDVESIVEHTLQTELAKQRELYSTWDRQSRWTFTKDVLSQILTAIYSLQKAEIVYRTESELLDLNHDPKRVTDAFVRSEEIQADFSRLYGLAVMIGAFDVAKVVSEIRVTLIRLGDHASEEREKIVSNAAHNLAELAAMRLGYSEGASSERPAETRRD